MSLNVLVVEDSEVMRGMIKKSVRLSGVPLGQIVEAKNGKEALSLLGKHWIDLVFVDVNMPVMSGGELIREMKEDAVLSATPIVLLTSEGHSARIDKLKSLGVIAYLRKPCSPESIRCVLEQVAGKRQAPSRQEQLEKVTGDVFQNFAFMFCEPIEDKADIGPETKNRVCGRMLFKGQTSGELRLLAPEDLCWQVACNVLGVDSLEKKSRSIARDSLGEMLNVICGHVLTGLGGEGRSFRLSGPFVNEVDENFYQEFLQQPDVLAFSVEDEVVLINISGEKCHA